MESGMLSQIGDGSNAVLFSWMNQMQPTNPSPATAPVHCRLWNLEWGGMQSLECEERGVLSGECCMLVVCRVWSGDCEV